MRAKSNSMRYCMGKIDSYTVLHKQKRPGAVQIRRLHTSAGGTSVDTSREPTAGDSLWTARLMGAVGEDLRPRAGIFRSKERAAIRC
jgi:hypothetical protein